MRAKVQATFLAQIADAMVRLIKAAAVLPLLAAALLAGTAAQAQQVTLSVIETVEIGLDESALDESLTTGSTGAVVDRALATFGPFRVVDAVTAEMHGVVDGATPGQFKAMRAAYPQLRTLRMIECPGSEDDEANLALGRMVRAARIETIVPAGGSVRSGAVELFLAGVRRQADSQAEFAVHSWRDSLGREADDLAQDDPVHREYLEFYREMGLSDDSARRFYALTSSVSFDDALYLAPLQMAAMGLLDVI